MNMTATETFGLPDIWMREQKIPWTQRQILYFLYASKDPITIPILSYRMRLPHRILTSAINSLRSLGLLEQSGERILPTKDHCPTVSIPRWLVFADIPPELIDMLAYLRLCPRHLSANGDPVYQIIKFGRKQPSLANRCRTIHISSDGRKVASAINPMLELAEKHGLIETVREASGGHCGLVRLANKFPAGLETADWEGFETGMFFQVDLEITDEQPQPEPEMILPAEIPSFEPLFVAPA